MSLENETSFHIDTEQVTYLLKRNKNNIAVRKSRQKTKEKQTALVIENITLKTENNLLKTKNQELLDQLQLETTRADYLLKLVHTMPQ
jgi:basic region leucine zipper protein